MITETKNTKAFYNTEIPVDWDVCSLGSLADKKKKWSFTGGPFGSNLKAEDYTETGIRIIQLQNIGDGEFLDNYKIYTSEKKADELLSCNIYPGEIILSKMGDPVARGCFIPTVDSRYLMASDGIRVLTDSERVHSFYLLSFINYTIFRTEAIKISTGSTRQRIGLDDLKSIKIPLPPLPEQKAIALVLSTADAAIHTTEKLIAQKELRKKWLMQQLLTGKKRLNGFGGEVKLKVVDPYLKEISERNKDLKITNVLSVTNSRGFINQADQFDRVVASEDATNYKIVRKWQFAYNPSRVNVGSLDLLRDFESGILSPMYVVFETNTSHLLPYYFYYQLKTQWFYGHIPMFVQGSVRDSLSFDGLCSMKFFIPSIEEQTAIAQVLQAADKEISLLKAKAEKLREQKKGLMQVLLTGRKRLKIENNII